MACASAPCFGLSLFASIGRLCAPGFGKYGIRSPFYKTRLTPLLPHKPRLAPRDVVSNFGQASSPPFFERRGGAFIPPRVRGAGVAPPGLPEGTERRAAPVKSTPLGAGARIAGRAPLSAPSRDFGRRDRASGTRTAGSSPALSRSFRPARPVPSSPCGQPHIVGADGDPSLPGAGLRAPHAGAASHPDRMTSHENALGG